MKNIFFIVWFFSLYAYSYKFEIKVHDSIRKLAGATETQNLSPQDENLLVYESPETKNGHQVWKMNAQNWLTNTDVREDTRKDFLVKLYYANTRSISRSGQKHIGCFMGNAVQVANLFFKTIDTPEELVKTLKRSSLTENDVLELDGMFVSVSEDQKMLGIEFKLKNQEQARHFRLPHCIQGSKSPLVTEESLKTAQINLKKFPHDVALLKSFTRQPSSENSLIPDDGFEIADKIADDEKNQEIKLPEFKLHGDYDKIVKAKGKRPWEGLDITTQAGAEKFALTALDYFYDSLVQDDKNPNFNFIAQNIKLGKSHWCHMPWLNVGESGREAIHGLTKERDLQASAIYPQVKNYPGADWGIGFYNDVACDTIRKVFGTATAQNTPPNFKNVKFPNGSASVKILFTTSQLPELKKSFTWTAHVCGPQETDRRLQNVKMVQIDLAIKDKSIKGVKADADNWMMSTFYFDDTYKPIINFKNPLLKSPILSGLTKMRPIGVQTGFDPSTSLILTNSKTNSAQNVYYPKDDFKLLNGPADNTKGSCMSCHGAAGTTLSMVPGIKDFAHYASVKNNALDFSMQLSFAKRNYETRAHQFTTK